MVRWGSGGNPVTRLWLFVDTSEQFALMSIAHFLHNKMIFLFTFDYLFYYLFNYSLYCLFNYSSNYFVSFNYYNIYLKTLLSKYIINRPLSPSLYTFIAYLISLIVFLFNFTLFFTICFLFLFTFYFFIYFHILFFILFFYSFFFIYFHILFFIYFFIYRTTHQVTLFFLRNCWLKKFGIDLFTFLFNQIVFERSAYDRKDLR